MREILHIPTEYLSSEVNVLTNRLKISDMTEAYFF